MTDPAAQLADDLAREGRPTLGWCVENVSDGDLGAALARLWLGCGDAAVLLRICAPVVDRAATVQAACDCARTALRFVPAELSQPRSAIETAERRARGLASVEECRAAAADAAGSTHGAVFGASSAPLEVAQAVSCAAYAAAYAAEAAAVLGATAAAHAAARVATYAAEACAHDAASRPPAADAEAETFAVERARSLARLGDVVRARVTAAMLVAGLVREG